MKTDKFKCFDTDAGSFLINAIQEARKIVLVTHVGPDVDGLACEVAAHRCLAGLGKSVMILNSADYSKTYSYIDPDGHIQVYSTRHVQDIAKADMMLALDVSEPQRIGAVFDVARSHGIPVFALDHHPRTERSVPGLLDPRFSSASEMVFGLLRRLGCPMDAQTAFTLYCGIIYDTQMFRFLKNDAQTFEVAASLVEAGADADKAQQLMYGSRPVDRLKLLARVVQRMRIENNGRLAWSAADQDVLHGLNVDSADLREMVSEILSIDGVMVAAFFRPGSNGRVKVSLRSKPPFRVDQVARQFNGGGHPQASGCDLQATMQEAVNQVLDALRVMPEFE